MALLQLFTLVCLVTAGYGEAENKFSQSLNTFTVNWLQYLSKSSAENVLTSPVAVGSVLGIIQQGAKGNSASQLEQTLHLNVDEAKEGFRGLTSTLKQKKEDHQVDLAWGSGGYIKKDQNVNQEFKDNVRANFEAGIHDEYENAETAATQLNAEISNITKGVINDLFTPSAVKDAAALFYSALYFKGKWASPFKRAKTDVDKFHITAENSIDNVHFMDQILFAKTGEDQELGAKWVQLAYDDSDYSMLLVLPTQKYQLNAVIEKLTASNLQNMISTKDKSRLRVYLPKFKLTQKGSIVESLKQLGICDIFTSQADLTGITSSQPPLAVSDIIQQVNVDVDEDGSTAAAAVGAVFFPLSFEVNPEAPNEFRADEPFLFFIVHTTDKIPLFVGKIVKPQL